LPAHPQIFHGRESELEHIVSILGQDQPRIAILGTGGMGKTTLATAVIHHRAIETKYSQRYFISCHAMTSSVDIISAIASHIGLDSGSSLKKVLQLLESDSMLLLVLDNFETPWEPMDSRKKVEDLLAHLAAISNLAIMITMRGAERPGNIQWSHPFLPPLGPITDSATLRTFLDITDYHPNSDEASITVLLGLTGNLPLAITLISSAVAYEGCDAILARWKVEKTHVVSDGYDKRSNLEISIMLSLSSPRMTPDAAQLLSLLSVLPDGLSNTELIQCNLPISNILGCKATLLRLTLAMLDCDGRLKLLVPIREYVSSIHPPPKMLKRPVRHYLHKTLEMWRDFENLQLSPTVVTQIGLNIGNLNSLLMDALQAEPSDITVLQSIIYLHEFTQQTSRPLPASMLFAMKQMTVWQNHPAYGDFLNTILGQSASFPMLDVTAHISEGNKYFQNASPRDKGKELSSLRKSSNLP
ncbi:P-loop containing nucleoside triphosphate hydrolase protein, partial [Mycena galericulata]